MNEGTPETERSPSAPVVSKNSRLPIGTKRPKLAWEMVAAISAVVGAVAAVWPFVKLDPPPKFVQLLWKPSDCGDTEPLVGIGTCSEIRTLAWLRSQVLGFRSCGVPGYSDLQGTIDLRPVAHRGQANLIVRLAAGGIDRWVLGIGYDAKHGVKDGGLRLYRWTETNQMGPVMRLEADGSWWLDDGDGRLRKASPR